MGMFDSHTYFAWNDGTVAETISPIITFEAAVMVYQNYGASDDESRFTVVPLETTAYGDKWIVDVVMPVAQNVYIVPVGEASQSNNIYLPAVLKDF